MKRKRHASKNANPPKRSCGLSNHPTLTINHLTKSLLSEYYQGVHTLRHYLISRIAKSSKKRRRALLHYGHQHAGPAGDPALSELLDSIIVGTLQPVSVDALEDLDDDITVFTQQVSETDVSIAPSSGHLTQAEIVDFAVWNLFRRTSGTHRPGHLLCHAFQRSPTSANGAEVQAAAGIPGVYSCGMNPYFKELKGHPWNALPDLIGRGADSTISHLLTSCGLFRPIFSSSNVIQICGVPMSDMKVVQRESMISLKEHPTSLDLRTCKDQSKDKLADIRFLRHRMLYAKASLNAAGSVKFGLDRMHILSRLCNVQSDQETLHLMKYIFPRQFGLHNVFTSSTDYRDTSQQFLDYTLREEEISRARLRRKFRPGKAALPEDTCPRRLRGEARKLVQRLRKRHARCSYKALLDYYCPRHPKSAGSLDQASDNVQVSSFCRAVVRRVFPDSLFGRNPRNLDIVLKSVDGFVGLRRFETYSLHDVLQDIHITDAAWPAPPPTGPGHKIAQSDLVKRKELMAEIIYFLFDSFLVPLIRSQFHVTESGVQRNQLFYFRHDVWKQMTEPALQSLKLNMLEECSLDTVKNAAAQRALGVSKVRLLPKEHGMRPIINLRRRIQRQQRRETVLGRSINSILTPAFAVLNCEKATNPSQLGSALFSMNDIFGRLQQFRASLAEQGLSSAPLYFAKVDVKACFDTIPQERLMQLATNLLSAEKYNITKYARAKLVGGHHQETPGFGSKPTWKFLTKAAVDGDAFDFASEVQYDAKNGRTRTVYIDGVVRRSEDRHVILNLLHEHVSSNMIKLGNRTYRQKKGIPQGSIVSSLLCSYFYGELEQKVLGFVDSGRSLLLRLIDDFLVITTDLTVASRFINTMHAGIPEFGVEIKVDKSCVNFDMNIDKVQIPRLPAAGDFPYCGHAIHTTTLDLTKDMVRSRKNNLEHAVTVEFSKLPGQSFYRKTLNAVKLQMHAMLLSTRYNSLETVLLNLHHAFSEVARKTYHYIRSLPSSKQPSGMLVIKTVDDTMKLACILMKRRKSTSKDILPYECAVTTAQARWLASKAFLSVFHKRQTRFRTLIAWLEIQLKLVARRAQAPQLLQAAVERYGG